MTRKWFLLLALVVGDAILPAVAALPAKGSFRDNAGGKPVRYRHIDELYRALPLNFEANLGQFDSSVQFVSRARGYTLLLTPGETVLGLRRNNDRRCGSSCKKTAVMRMTLVGANREAPSEGLEKLPGTTNYFVGQDASRWRTRVPTYAKVRYRNIYPGTDLIYYGNQRNLEYDFVLAPGANPGAIQLAISGADRLRIEQGNLLLEVGGEQIRLQKPVIYQVLEGVQRAVSGRYILKGRNRIGFDVTAYDRTRPLVIDPLLSIAYATYLGGKDDDTATSIALDATGNVYVAGRSGDAHVIGARPEASLRSRLSRLLQAGSLTASLRN